MVLQRHLAIGLLDVVRVELRRKAQPERVIETVLSTTIHLNTPSSSDVFGQPPLADDTTPALVHFANFFWGVKLRDSVCETFFHFFASCSALFAPLRGEG